MLAECSVSIFVRVGYWEAYRLSVIITASCLRWLLYLLGFAVLCWLVLPLLVLSRTVPENRAILMHNVVVMGWLFGAVLVILFVFPLLSARRVVTDKRLKGGVTYQLSKAGIYIENPIAKTDLSWSGIQEISELRSGFLLFISRSNAISLPKRCFSSSDDVTAVRELFRVHVPAVKLRND
jgi:YcxB-like protein